MTHGWWRGALHWLWAARMLSSILSPAVGSSPSAECTCAGVHVQAPNTCPLQDHVNSLEGSFCGLIHDPMPVTCCVLCLVHAPPFDSAKSASHRSCPVPSACCLPCIRTNFACCPSHLSSSTASTVNTALKLHLLYRQTRAHLSIHASFAADGAAHALQDQHGSPLPHDESPAQLVEGPGSFMGLFGVLPCQGSHPAGHTEINDLAHGLACGLQVRHMKCPGPATMQDRLCCMPCLPC